MKVSEYHFYNSWNAMTAEKSKQNISKKQPQLYFGMTSSKKKQTSGIVIKRNISASKYLLRLAGAGSVPRVSGVVRSARADMSFVRSSGASQEQITRAIRILKKVIAKGNIKIGRLKIEKQLRVQKKIAEKLRNGKKVEELSKKLRSKKRYRRTKELVDAADMESVTIESRSHKQDYREEVKAYQALESQETSIDVAISNTSAISAAVDTSIDAGIAASVDISI